MLQASLMVFQSNQLNLVAPTDLGQSLLAVPLKRLWEAILPGMGGGYRTNRLGTFGSMKSAGQQQQLSLRFLFRQTGFMKTLSWEFRHPQSQYTGPLLDKLLQRGSGKPCQCSNRIPQGLFLSRGTQAAQM
jgi:hypothetical protein